MIHENVLREELIVSVIGAGVSGSAEESVNGMKLVSAQKTTERKSSVAGSHTHCMTLMMESKEPYTRKCCLKN